MKTLMKNTLAAVMLAGLAVSASAQNFAGKTTQELGQKIANEVMMEVMTEVQKAGDKQPSQEELGKMLGKKMADKMRANLTELKKGATEDCTNLYGQDKASNCACVTDKTDYEGMFVLIEKQMANPQTEMTAEMTAQEKKNEEAYQACDLDIAVMKKASEAMAQEAAKAMAK